MIVQKDTIKRLLTDSQIEKLSKEGKFKDQGASVWVHDNISLYDNPGEELKKGGNRPGHDLWMCHANYDCSPI